MGMKRLQRRMSGQGQSHGCLMMAPVWRMRFERTRVGCYQSVDGHEDQGLEKTPQSYRQARSVADDVYYRDNVEDMYSTR